MGPLASGQRMMKALICLRRLALVAGVALLAIYAGIRVDGALQSRARVRALQRPAERHLREAWPDRVPEVNFRLWSPSRVHGYWASLERAVDPPLAVLRIPKIGLEVPVLSGLDEDALNRGVGWIPGTAAPGAFGNVGIAGHRDGFFRGLKDVRVGDSLELQTPHSQEHYIVDAIEIVTPDRVSVLGPRAARSLTLVTCYPFYVIGHAPQRYIVHASIVEGSPGGASAGMRTRVEEREQ